MLINIFLIILLLQLTSYFYELTMNDIMKKKTFGEQNLREHALTYGKRSVDLLCLRL